jgi:hypothetical protein
MRNDEKEIGLKIFFFILFEEEFIFKGEILTSLNRDISGLRKLSVLVENVN